MKVEFDVTTEEAEEILFSMALRSKQKNLPPQMQEDTAALAARMEEVFVKTFGWDSSIKRISEWRDKFKNVNINLK